MQPSSSYHPTDSYYHQPAGGAGRTGHDTSIDSQYGSSGSMDHPYGDHTHGAATPQSIQANYTSSPYLYRDNPGIHSTPPHKHHKGLPSYSDLNRMSPIPEVGYNAPNRTASYNAPKSGPVINLHSTNSYRERNRQASDTVVWSQKAINVRVPKEIFLCRPWTVKGFKTARQQQKNNPQCQQQRCNLFFTSNGAINLLNMYSAVCVCIKMTLCNWFKEDFYESVY